MTKLDEAQDKRIITRRMCIGREEGGVCNWVCGDVCAMVACLYVLEDGSGVVGECCATVMSCTAVSAGGVAYPDLPYQGIDAPHTEGALWIETQVSGRSM